MNCLRTCLLSLPLAASMAAFGVDLQELAKRYRTACDVWSDEAAGWLAQFRHPAKRVAFLGDSITDRRHIGCTKNYWGFLGERYGFEPLVYGINGQQMSDILGQAAKLKVEHPEPMGIGASPR